MPCHDGKQTQCADEHAKKGVILLFWKSRMTPFSYPGRWIARTGFEAARQCDMLQAGARRWRLGLGERAAASLRRVKTVHRKEIA